MKLNWGHKIVLVYSLFVLMIGFFVYRSIHEGFDLESSDYYDKEVKYQQQINREQNTLALVEKPAAGYIKKEQAVEIKFPTSIDPGNISGEINFFKPDNASLDFTVRINLETNNIQKIDASKLKPGAWKVGPHGQAAMCLIITKKKYLSIKMNIALMISALAVGFLGSFHCVGMCGPIAAALPKGSESNKRIYIGSILYNLGRIVTYSILGLTAGLIGYSFSIKGFQGELSIISGVVIVIMVLFSNQNKLSINVSRFLGKYTLSLKQQFKILFTKGSPAFLFSIGLLNGLLPCGFVYLALAGALATGHYAGGMAYMALFGLGTFPAMLVISLAGHFIGSGVKMHIRRISPVIAIALAVLLIYRGSDYRQAKCCETNMNKKECSVK